jgi:hypothetical protein
LMNFWPVNYFYRGATVKIVHRSEIHHKSSPPRGWDGCTFVGADLRVCYLWVRSRSLAANLVTRLGVLGLQLQRERSRLRSVCSYFCN